MVDNDYLGHRGAYATLRKLLQDRKNEPFSSLDVACGDACMSAQAPRGTWYLTRGHMTTWEEPVNAAGARDLLGDRSDRVVEQHHNLASGVEASRRIAKLLALLK